jgi:P27 family predicted phage terminase small subunit
MMKKQSVPRAPQHLSREAKALWRRLHEEWFIPEAGSVAILIVALESFDRCQSARRTLAADGLTIRDKFGQLKIHPLCSVARDAEAGFRAALRQIGIDKAPAENPPRPGRPCAKI